MSVITDRVNAGNKIFRLAKAGGRKAAVLLVMQRNLLAGGTLNLMRHSLIAYAKWKDLWQSAGQVDHRELAFPAFAQPSFMGNLLDVTRPFAGRITKMQREPSPSRKSG